MGRQDQSHTGRSSNGGRKNPSGVELEIAGTGHRRKPRIVRSMIPNLSNPGAPYNQFPAPIPVDGKPAREAAYNRLSQTKS
jgi:hypothetical protein